MGDFSARLDSYNVYLPKQTRWQAELFLEDLKADPQVNAALADFGKLASTAAKVSNERLSVQEFVHQERMQTLDDLQRQRIATIAALHAERLGVAADLDSERLAATADLRGERQTVLNALRDHGGLARRGYQFARRLLQWRWRRSIIASDGADVPRDQG